MSFSFNNLCLTFSDELDDINKQIGDLTAALDQSIKATKPHEDQLNALKEQVNNIKNRILTIEKDIASKKIKIDEGYKDLDKQEKILYKAINDYYIKSYYYSPILIFLSSSKASDITQLLAYQKAATDQDKLIITNIAITIQDLETKKQKLESEQKSLSLAKADLDEQSAKLDELVSGAKAYQSQLSTQIAELSAKQQELLAQKFSSAPVPKLAVTSLGGCSSDIGKSPGFSPAFGFFSFGVPNRTGLNQYGAKGRADAGQGYEEILNAYYANFAIQDYDTSINIIVNGTNEYGQSFNNESFNIEEYLKHLYEMPSGWDSKALKAQAIAARSYALSRTENGRLPIPPNQSGQVVKKELNSQEWINAVEETKGKVMTNNGNPITAWYSSTHGGFTLKSGQIGWNDTPWTKNAPDASAFESMDQLQNSAYDKSSPWFYCDWGYRKEYNNTAWLKEEEVVDIVNAYILWEMDNSLISHLSQTDKSTPDTWSSDKVKEEIRIRGKTPLGSISSISVNWENNGISRTININGISLDAQKFKNMFNLRAPGNIQLKPTCQPNSDLSCGMYSLYNVERM